LSASSVAKELIEDAYTISRERAGIVAECETFLRKRRSVRIFGCGDERKSFLTKGPCFFTTIGQNRPTAYAGECADERDELVPPHGHCLQAEE